MRVRLTTALAALATALAALAAVAAVATLAAAASLSGGPALGVALQLRREPLDRASLRMAAQHLTSTHKVGLE